MVSVWLIPFSKPSINFDPIHHILAFTFYYSVILFIFFILLHRWVHVNSPSALNISYVHGPTSVSLLSLTVGQSLQTTVNKWPDREAVVFVQDGVRKTFSQFQHEVGSFHSFYDWRCIGLSSALTPVRLVLASG